MSIELRQEMAGYSHSSGLFMGFSARFGSPMVRRAARATIDEALDGLERNRWLTVAEPSPTMRWWGWGDPAHPPALPAHALDFLRETVGVAPRPSPPVALGQVRIAPTTLSEATTAALREIVGAEGVRDDHAERVVHAAGKGYPDLVRLRAGLPEGAPDAVVRPSDREQLRAVLDRCAQASVAVVPWGGGTSVVGGVAPLRGEHAAVIALDMERMAGVLELDRVSRTVTVQAGIRAPALERALAPSSFTLGHFPQSYEYVSLGRLCGDALGGTGLEWLRPDRADGAGAALRRARGRDRARAGPRQRRGAGAAPAAGRLGGDARRDRGADAARASRAARARL